MNELVPVMEAQTLEDVLASGDLSKLTPEQRVAYYFRVCDTLGLNPYTRPFDYITLNGKRVLYAKRDATDQLRQKRQITLAVTDKHIEDDLYIVTVRATDAKGRSDEDFGAVSIAGTKGEARANAILKAITKAKRRVTLSICGLGMNDESEVLTIPGAVTEDLVLPPPDARDAMNADIPLKAAATGTGMRGARIEDRAKSYDSIDLSPLLENHGPTWLKNLETLLMVTATDQEEILAIGGHFRVSNTLADKQAPADVKRRVTELLANGYKRFAEPDTEAPDPELEVVGERYAAG